MANNFIELNGNRYDATTGAFLGKPTQQSTTNTLKSTLHSNRLDDILQPNVAITHTNSATHVQHAHPNHVAPHHPQHAKTLRRDGVRQPTIEQKMAIRTQAPAKLTAYKPGALALKPKLSSEVVDIARANRAEGAVHSSKIERFHHTPIPTHLAPVPVRQAPGGNTMDMVSPTRATAQPHPAIRSAEPPTNKSNDIFEQALARATSHEQASPKEATHQKIKHVRRRHKRGLQIATSGLVILLLSGFIFWQNRASVEMQLAAARSGVAANLPGYRPQGFAFNHLTYSPGTVTIGFSNSNNKTNYNIIQKSSNWDSETLLENFVATTGQPYNAFSAAGRTVYIYGNGDATWVNGGVWYQINDNGVLNQDQVIKVATSI